MSMKLTIYCGDYHWFGSLKIGESKFEQNIDRYGDGKRYRYDPFDYLARVLLKVAADAGHNVTAEQILVDERWEHLQSAKQIEKDLTSDR
jgi:hypothetical protein